MEEIDQVAAWLQIGARLVKDRKQFLALLIIAVCLAIGGIAVSAAGLGWETRLLESVTDSDLAVLLGVHIQTGVEAEHADCLMAVFAQGPSFTIDEQRLFAIPDMVSDELRGARWSGVPNRLSSDHHLWPVIDEVAAATEKRSSRGRLPAKPT